MRLEPQAQIPPAPPDEGAVGVLGVERSFTGRLWRAAECDERRASVLCRQGNLPDLLARVLDARGITPDGLDSYLDPKLRALLPDPSSLQDMDRAAERLAAAITAGEIIAVFGDYDVDGATSSALLTRFFRSVGAHSLLHIPDRIAEGYGPNAPAMLALGAQGAKVIVTVDCGVSAHAPIAAAREAGLDVIVLDHHAPDDLLPPATALVNPKRRDETGELAHLAAVGVAFLAAVAVTRALREAGWFAQRAEPDLLSLLDLVALGTVCDVVPLTGLNRAFVAQGLKVMAARRNAGLAALADIARVDGMPAAFHLGFLMGPRVNAGGRVGSADFGARLLACDDPIEARRLAEALDGFNRDRQTIEATVEAEAIAQVEQMGLDRLPVILSWGQGWHPGVVGIVASRLKDRYERPACVVTIEGDRAKGSGRSIKGFDLGAAMIAAREQGLLLTGGGHAMAAGFTLAVDRLPEFGRFLEARVAESFGGAPPTPELVLDGVIGSEGVTPELAELLERLGPYGAGNPEPRFAVPNAMLHKVDEVGGRHVRCLFGPVRGGPRLSAIAFRAVDTPLGSGLFRARGTPVHLVGRIKLDRWNGREAAQLQIDDAAPAW